MMISRIGSDDLSFIVRIEQSINPFPWTFGHFEASFAAGHLGFVLRSPDQKIIGYCFVSTVLDEAELLLIGVAPEYQYQGLGSRLWVFVQEYLIQQQIKKIFLEVRVSNTKAISFYKKIGFVEISRRKDYYVGNGVCEDAVVMSLTIF